MTRATQSRTISCSVPEQASTALARRRRGLVPHFHYDRAAQREDSQDVASCPDVEPSGRLAGFQAAFRDAAPVSEPTPRGPLASGRKREYHRVPAMRHARHATVGFSAYEALAQRLIAAQRRPRRVRFDGPRELRLLAMRRH